MAPAMPTYDSESSHQPNPDPVPTLDLSCFREAKELDGEVLKTLEEAFELGFFRVVNHGIPGELLHNADKVCREVFKLPTSTKEKNTSSSCLYGSYSGGVPHVPFWESLGIVGVPNPEAIKAFSDLMWPEGNQQFCEIIEDYTANFMELSKTIHNIILDRWGMGKYYEPVFNQGFHVFRMNMYETAGIDLPSESLGLSPHHDTDSLTFLLEDGEGGLQVEDKDGKWMDVKSVPNTILVFVGDTFEAWSNGRIHSVRHRVMVKGRKSRLTLRVFTYLPDDMKIEAPSELVDDDHPKRYRAFGFRELVDFKAREQEVANPLKAYTGMG